MYTYEFRLTFLVAGIAFMTAASLGEWQTGVWWAAGLLFANYLLQLCFKENYAFDVVPVSRSARYRYWEFEIQYFSRKNLYTHPVTILSALVVFWFSGSIYELIESSIWFALLALVVALMLFSAVPAQVWGMFALMRVDSIGDTVSPHPSVQGYDPKEGFD